MFRDATSSETLFTHLVWPQTPARLSSDTTRQNRDSCDLEHQTCRLPQSFDNKQMCSDDIWPDELPKWSYREIFSLKAWLWILNSTVSISYYAHGSPCFPRNPENKSNLTWVRTLNGSQAQQVAFFLMSYPEGDFKRYPLGTPTWKIPPEFFKFRTKNCTCAVHDIVPLRTPHGSQGQRVAFLSRVLPWRGLKDNLVIYQGRVRDCAISFCQRCFHRKCRFVSFFPYNLNPSFKMIRKLEVCKINKTNHLSCVIVVLFFCSTGTSARHVRVCRILGRHQANRTVWVNDNFLNPNPLFWKVIDR